MRRIAVAMVVLAAGCGIVGCGSGKTASTHTANSLGGSGSITKAQAIAYAHAVNLTASDVPELTSAAPGAEASVKRRDVERARCAGAASPYSRVVNIGSARFTGATASPRESVTSSVVVWPTSAIAEQNIAADLSPRGRACVQHLLERLAIGAVRRVRVSHVSLAWLPAPLPAAHSFAARLSLTLSAEPGRLRPGLSGAVVESPSPRARPVQISVYIDVLGFLVGPGEVNLTATGEKRPASSATEHRLLSLLYSRAVAHKL
jgi:hypothetical protein